MTDHAHNRVIGFRAGRIEEDVLEIPAELFSHLCGERNGWRRRSFEECIIERQFQHLLVCRFGQFLAAIPNVHAPEPRHAIE